MQKSNLSHRGDRYLSLNTFVKFSFLIECEDIIPQELNIRTTTGNKVNVSWQPPSNLTEPCREVLVPAKQRNVALCELAADLKYIVQERARTAKGPGDYCKEKTFETDGKKGWCQKLPIRINWISIELD